MEIYRASKSPEVVIGAHFTTDESEAQVYTEIEINNGCDAFGGVVRKYECGGEVLSVGQDVRELIEALQEMAEKVEVDFSTLGMISTIAEKYTMNGLIDLDEVDASDIANELRDFGVEYVFHAIEKVEGVVDALNGSEYAWIEWEAQSIKEGIGWNDDVRTTTYRYLGGGSVKLA